MGDLFDRYLDDLTCLSGPRVPIGERFELEGIGWDMSVNDRREVLDDDDETSYGYTMNVIFYL